MDDEDLVEKTALPLHEKDMRHYFVQLIAGLEYLHFHGTNALPPTPLIFFEARNITPQPSIAIGILHRDIKPR